MNKKKPVPDSQPQQIFHNEISELWPLAKGSLSEVRKPCNRKGCKACADGTKHPAFIYTYRDDGKLRCLHVRPEFVEQVRQAIKNGRKLEEMLTGLGRDYVERLRGDCV